MSVGDVLAKTAGVYFCIKNRDSVFLWVNENFAQLVGQRPQDLIGTRDSRAAHGPHSQWFGVEVLGLGFALINCCLAPAWRKEDASIPSPAQVTALKDSFPAQAPIIDQLAVAGSR